MNYPISTPPPSENKGWSYVESMYHLSQIISTRLNPEAIDGASYAQILDDCSAVEGVRNNLLPQLRSKEACKSATDRLQYLAIQLHTSFVVSLCCRPALPPRSQSIPSCPERPPSEEVQGKPNSDDPHVPCHAPALHSPRARGPSHTMGCHPLFSSATFSRRETIQRFVNYKGDLISCPVRNR